MDTLADLAGMALFVKIVEDGSLSAAGRSLGLPKATVSRRLARLESRVGAALLARSTRASSLTDAGHRFFERVRPIVREAEAAHREIADCHAQPSGRLRVSASIAFGQAVVAPTLIGFVERYPTVRVDLHLGDERVDIVADGFDLAIRMGEIEDSDLISRRLADMSMVIVAAPAYIRNHGMPAGPRDLRDHTAVLTRPDLDHWDIAGDIVRVRWRMSTGSMAATRDAALMGIGVARVPEFAVAGDLRNGALVRVLAQYALPKSRATALYPRSVAPSLALKMLLEQLVALPLP